MYTLGMERESSNNSKCICEIIENRVSRIWDVYTLFIVVKSQRVEASVQVFIDGCIEQEYFL